VRNNVIHDTHVPAGNDGDSQGLIAEGAFPPARTDYLIEGNRIYNPYRTGMYLHLQRGTTVRQNVIYSCGESGVGIHFSNYEGYNNYDVSIYNNTVYACPGGGVVLSSTKGATLRNNLLFGNGNHRQILSSGLNSDISTDYNVLAPMGSDFDEGRHSIIRPKISDIVVNAAGADFHLLAGGCAAGKGTNLFSLTNLAKGTTAFNVDFDKLIRPRGLSWSIGAYEYIGAPKSRLPRPSVETGVPRCWPANIRQ